MRTNSPENRDPISDHVTCVGIVNLLLSHWSEASRADVPSELLDHLCECSHCLRLWIALEAAADLAGCCSAADSSPAAIQNHLHLPESGH
jgi:hypothetical protein